MEELTPEAIMTERLTIGDLAGVVYSSGKVFEGLATGRLDTENFLRSGSTEGVHSRADLALLEDLRDVAGFVVEHAGRAIDAGFVRALNAQMTRSGALHPGEFRTAGQNIGVSTRYGRHLPPPQSDSTLQRLIDDAAAAGDDVEIALDLFIQLAKAQPFEDGNKRTALFTANAHLLSSEVKSLLVVPASESRRAADHFNDLLARAYLDNDDEGVKSLLRDEGLVPLSG